MCVSSSASSATPAFDLPTSQHHSTKVSRRTLLAATAAAGTGAALLPNGLTKASENDSGGIIDTNVSLGHWPFRRLPLDQPEQLVDQLRRLGIKRAWAGSYDAVFHRNLHAVNQRVLDICRRYPELVPVGSINPVLPNALSDLRRCVDEMGMRILRLYPGYHGYAVTDDACRDLLKHAAQADCLVQIAVALEDRRTQHAQIRIPDVSLASVADVVQTMDGLKVQLLNARLSASTGKLLRQTPRLLTDTARIDGTDTVPAVVESTPAGRVLFGSGAPLLIPQAALIRVHESGRLTVEQRQQVYHDNAAALQPGGIS